MATKKAAAPKPPKPAYRTSKKAQDALRAGDVDAAVAALTVFADEGDVSASYSLAEVHAFRHEWEGLLHRVAPLLANPSAIYAGNVVADAVCLAWRAARELGAWDEAIGLVDSMPADKLADGFFGRLARELRTLAVARGAGDPLRFSIARTEPLEKRVADWECTTEKAKAAGDLKRRFDSAVAYHLEDIALELYQSVRDKVDLDRAFFVAAALAKRGKSDEAWAAIELALPARWVQCVDTAQIAPARLIYDPALSPLLDEKRRKWVLETKRA